jgi:hypothetical protein
MLSAARVFTTFAGTEGIARATTQPIGHAGASPPRTTFAQLVKSVFTWQIEEIVGEQPSV